MPFIEAVSMCSSASPNEATWVVSSAGMAGTPRAFASTRPTNKITVNMIKMPNKAKTTRADSPRPRMVSHHVTAASAAPIRKCQTQLLS